MLFSSFEPPPFWLSVQRREVRSWLKEKRGLNLNLGKGEVKSVHYPHQYLGYRITPEGIDLGRKSIKRIKKKLKGLGVASPEQLQKTLKAWRGAVIV